MGRSAPPALTVRDVSDLKSNLLTAQSIGRGFSFLTHLFQLNVCSSMLPEETLVTHRRRPRYYCYCSVLIARCLSSIQTTASIFAKRARVTFS